MKYRILNDGLFYFVEKQKRFLFWKYWVLLKITSDMQRAELVIYTDQMRHNPHSIKEITISDAGRHKDIK